jgi:hypothetical protein
VARFFKVAGSVTVSARKRDEFLSRALSIIAEYGVTVVPADEPAEFVLHLSRQWKKRGGKVAGRRRHSDRYLDGLLKLRGTPVQSLSPKLTGKADLQPKDADALIRLYLSCWDYVGDPSSSQSIGQETLKLYQAMLSSEQAIAVAKFIRGRMSESGLEGGRALTLPGENTVDLVAAEFAKSKALLAVSSRRTLITPQPKRALLGFRDLMNRLWEVDRSDHNNRIIVWVLDLGPQEFEDASCFWNVQELRARFKALKSFKDLNAENRWSWLRSRAVIVLHDPQAEADEERELPTFTARDTLISEIPRGWSGLQQIRRLYGRKVDWLNEATVSIFLQPSVENSRHSLNHGDPYEMRYFGHALFVASGHPGVREARSLELPPPGESYEDAFRTVYMAATELLHSLGSESVGGKIAIDKLRRVRFRLMGLEEFIKDL